MVEVACFAAKAPTTATFRLTKSAANAGKRSIRRARGGKIYVDYLRNGRGATAVAAYSARARAGATVSTPLDWSELSPAIRPSHFTVDNLPTRLRHLGSDPWAKIGSVRQSLPSAAPRKRRQRADDG